MSESDTEQAVADALAALETGDNADLTLAKHDEPVTVFVRDLTIEHDGLAGVAERTVTLETLDGETLRVVLQLSNRPDATVELSHAVLGEDPDDCEYVRIQAVDDSSQQTLVPDGGVVDPEVVCLCGSTRFKEQYRAENRRLTMAGKIVLSVGLFGHADDIEISDAEKEMLDSLHKRKIDLADRIHVINVDGYIGESTQSEIEYARATDTEVTYLEAPVPDGGAEWSSINAGGKAPPGTSTRLRAGGGGVLYRSCGLSTDSRLPFRDGPATRIVIQWLLVHLALRQWVRTRYGATATRLVVLALRARITPAVRGVGLTEATQSGDSE